MATFYEDKDLEELPHITVGKSKFNKSSYSLRRCDYSHELAVTYYYFEDEDDKPLNIKIGDEDNKVKLINSVLNYSIQNLTPSKVPVFKFEIRNKIEEIISSMYSIFAELKARVSIEEKPTNPIMDPSIQVVKNKIHVNICGRLDIKDSIVFIKDGEPVNITSIKEGEKCIVIARPIVSLIHPTVVKCELLLLQVFS